MSDWRGGGHFLAASVSAEAVWRSGSLNSGFLVIDHAALGCGGGILDHCCYAWNQLIDQPWKIISIGTREWACR